jgi:hypothetical protein
MTSPITMENQLMREHNQRRNNRLQRERHKAPKRRNLNEEIAKPLFAF